MRSILGDPDSNLERIESHIEQHLGSDIICFPEMCLTGYTTSEPSKYAINPDDDRVQRLKELSAERGIAIVFGYIEKEGDRLHLRQEIAFDGKSGYYRKSHLGIKESDCFVPGDELPTFDVNGVCIGMHLCTETHIPEISATMRGKGAELIIAPFANGISSQRRRAVWHSYLPARASDNGVYVVGCSAVGDDSHGTMFGGGLIAIDPKGNVIDEYYGDDEHSITIEIGGRLPRDGPESMTNISYFDRRRPELYR